MVLLETLVILLFHHAKLQILLVYFLYQIHQCAVGDGFGVLKYSINFDVSNYL